MNEEKAALFPAQELRARGKARRRWPLMWIAPLLCMGFALACALGCGVFAPKVATRETAEKSSSRFTQLIPEEYGTPVAARITAGEEVYRVETDGDAYALDGAKAGIDAQAAGALLQSGASVLARNKVEGDEALFGLQTPALSAEFTYANGETLTLKLGDAPANGEGRYAAVSGQEGVWVVNASLYTALAAGKNALYALPDFSQVFTANTLMEVTLDVPGRETITIRRTTEENPFNTVAEFTAPIHYPANAERTATLFLALEALAPTGIAAVSGTDEAWGLDAPLCRLWLRGMQSALELTIGRVEETLTLRVGQEETVYTLAPDAADFVRTATVAYLAEQLPGLVALSQVKSLEIAAQGETDLLDVRAAGEDTAYLLNGQPMSEDDFKAVYQSVIGLLIDRYVPQRQEPGEPRATFTYTFTDGAAWTIAFAPYDEEYDIVIRDGEAAFLIARAKVDAVLEQIRQYREK